MFHPAIRILAIITLLACSTLTLLAASAVARPLDVANSALELLEHGNADAARTTLASVGADHAGDSLIVSVRALMDLYTGRIPEAEAACRKVLGQDPQSVLALWGLGLSLLERGRVFEATTVIDHAAAIAPNDARIKALQAYAYLLLGRITDAAIAGKEALEGGDRSPFLLATLAETHRRMGYPHKALEFGSFAAKCYYGMDFLAPARGVDLPLTMIITDTPQALANGMVDPGKAHPAGTQRTEMEIDLPKMSDGDAPKRILQVTAPLAGSTVRDAQQVQATYRGTTEAKFLVLLVDRVLRGMITDLPYQFAWDPSAVAPGLHDLCVRAYDYRGVLIAEDTVTVTTTSGSAPAPMENAVRTSDLQRRMIGATMPAPTPLSLFTRLGYWHKDVGEGPQALAAFEKAAAIDPTAEGVLDALSRLYSENGLHALSPNGEVRRGPATGRKRVALTFDDGPNPLYTPMILDVLKRYNAHATFFVVGKMAMQYRELTLEMLADGHELGNHTYTHPNLTKLKQPEIIAEALRTRAALKDITGRQTYLFRPPGGNIDEFVTKQFRALDYNIIYWSINAGEFRKNPPPQQAAQILSRVEDGSILLLHNGPVDGTINILPTLLSELNNRGYTFVTVTEMMSAK